MIIGIPFTKKIIKVIEELVEQVEYDAPNLTDEVLLELYKGLYEESEAKLKRNDATYHATIIELRRELQSNPKKGKITNDKTWPTGEKEEGGLSS